MDEYARRADQRERQAGRTVWLAGLVGLAGFLIISPLFSLTATLAVRSSTKKAGPRARENGRRALNWQLTYLALHLMLLPLHLALVGVERDAPDRFVWSTVTLTLLIAVFAVNLLLSVLGGVLAARGRVVNPLIAVPFIRPLD